MPSKPAYPHDLSRYVAAHWPSATPLTVTGAVLEEALAVAFQASMTTEEDRPTRFRLLLTPPDRLPSEGSPNEGVLRLLLDRTRPLAAQELRRLAPAVPFESALIGASAVEGGELRIWGIAHSGPAWLAPSWGGRDVVPNWTFDPIIHVTAPGQVAVRCAGALIGAIERGALVDTMTDVFASAWLREMFTREREEVRAKHAAHQRYAAEPTHVDHVLVGSVSQHMLRRVIRLVRGAHHGGLILVVDDDITDVRGLRLKYRLGQDEPAGRFRTLLFRILENVAGSTSKALAGWEDFASNPSAELAAVEKEVFEWSRVIANLAAIDGAVVLDKRFAVLGFGAEVTAERASPSRVFRALDVEATQRRAEDIETMGTRHRAAYRFVAEHPTALAIVVSHDGGVSFVADREGEIVVWEHSMSP